MTWNEASIDFLTQYGGLDLDTWHILKRFDITTIGDISLFSDEDLLTIDEFTEQNLSNLKNSIIKLTNEVKTNHLTPDVPLESTAKKEAFAEINRLQDEYVDELISLMNNPNYDSMKTIDFTSPTGTGKTKMMSKLINKMPDCYFIITTLSKGQLHIQVRNSLTKDCNQSNFTVYGSADYRINSKLDAEDIIGKIPDDTKCIWLRDEGHIRTNRFDELLIDVCYKVINVSATNMHNDIQCNFTSTMMLRTVNQDTGTPYDAICKLLEVKEAHKNVAHYNPCAIFRCVGGNDELYEHIVKICEENNLSYIDISENSFNMAELCEDDNEYDVIINKFKIVEGIDIRRAHVLYMDNQPTNSATTIQVIGRCRRNALLYRNDIDILAPENEELLKQTRECYVYYNVKNMKIDSDETGELQYAFCNHISCESLKPDSYIHVVRGQLPNGLWVTELDGITGDFKIIRDNDTGFNIVEPLTKFYDTVTEECNNNWIYTDYNVKILAQDLLQFPSITSGPAFSFHKGLYVEEYSSPHYDFGIQYYSVFYRSIHAKDIFKPITEEEKYAIKHGHLQITESISVEDLQKYNTKEYTKIINDKESAIIGVDLMHQIKQNKFTYWTESRSVSSKVGNYNKLNAFISTKYASELSQAKSQYFSGKNSFKLDTRCNSMLGYCVEYYSKYLVYGPTYLKDYMDDYARDMLNAHSNDPNNTFYKIASEREIMKACVTKYRVMMIRAFGTHVSKLIKNISAWKSSYNDLTELTIELGTKTAKYVKSTLYADRPAEDNIDPNLSIRHIAGLADYITEDTILDVKVKNCIDEKCVRQVLAYHYLSTKRSDLSIKRVIVYDAVSDKAVVINIDSKNQITNGG